MSGVLGSIGLIRVCLIWVSLIWVVLIVHGSLRFGLVIGCNGWKGNRKRLLPYVTNSSVVNFRPYPTREFHDNHR